MAEEIQFIGDKCGMGKTSLRQFMRDKHML